MILPEPQVWAGGTTKTRCDCNELCNHLDSHQMAAEFATIWLTLPHVTVFGNIRGIEREDKLN